MDIPNSIATRMNLISFYEKEMNRERLKLRFDLIDEYQNKKVTYYIKSSNEYITCKISSVEVHDGGILLQLTSMNLTGVWYASFDEINLEE